MQLETDRLIIAPAHRDFAEDVLQLHLANRKHFSLGSPQNLLAQTDLEFWRKKLAAEMLLFEKKMQYGFYGRLKSSNQLICHIQISNIVRGVFQAAHIGYKIDSLHEGRGLMREALDSVIHHLFYNLNLHRLMANYQPVNERSGYLLKRLGFKAEGFAEKYLYLDGEWKDHILTSLTNADFDDSRL